MTPGTRISTGGILALALLTSGVSQGAPFAYRFAGVITRVNDPNLILDESVQIGTPLSGEFGFDSEAEDLDPLPYQGKYQGPYFSLALSFASCSGVSTAGDGTIYVANDSFAGDALAIGGGPIDIHESLQVSSFSGSLQDATGSVFSSDSLPSHSFLYSDFHTSSFVVKGEGIQGLASFELLGTFSTFNVVPEATALPFVLWGLLACRARRIETH